MKKMYVAVSAICALAAVVHALVLGFAFSVVPNFSFWDFANVAWWAYPLGWLCATVIGISFFGIIKWGSDP